MQRLDRWRTWDLSSVQMQAFSIESPFLGCRQWFPGRAMNRFLPVADVLGCGELVDVKGWETRRLACCGPLMAYKPRLYKIANPREAHTGHEDEADVIKVLACGTKGYNICLFVLFYGDEGGIVSEGVAQVLDDVGNPRSHCGV